MKVAIAQINYLIGDFEGNYQSMLHAIEEARAQGADIVVFGELAVCGYPPRDFLEFRHFIEKSQEIITKLCAKTHNIAVVVGAPTLNPLPEGKDLFNSAYFLHDNKVQYIAHKALLPTYDIFDEYRYFEPARTFDTVLFKGKRIALTVCEDIWNIDNKNPLYTICPMDELRHQAIDFMINISASPFSYAHAAKRVKVVQNNAKRYNVPVFYANHVGAQTEIIFDGGSLVANAQGIICDEMPYFVPCVRTYEVATLAQVKENKEQVKEKYALIHQALITGIRDYFGKLGFSKAILGLSGGVDSALTLVLATQALGAENVMSVLMPSRYSSQHSIDDSLALVKNLGSPHQIISIEEPFAAMLETLTPHFDNRPSDVTEENLQARLRANILMGLSNKFGYILLNTSNKSEAAVGYGTLYGDMCGGLSVIGDVYKTEVYKLCAHINAESEIIPRNILEKAPSAELRPNQKDSDSLPDYDILDEILFQYIEKQQGPREIIAAGFEEKLVRRVLRLVNINEYKRYQTPPMLRVSSKAFGMGRRMPIVAKYLS
ncbi:MAG: NAD+ synthase [Chitinophagales bacterium]|nr:NAD+ synthase [Bacteroidota bacterium]